MRAGGNDGKGIDVADKWFQVMVPEKTTGCPTQIPWEILVPFAGNAVKNHDQTLERLNSRGGLSPTEVYCVMTGLTFREAFRLMTKQQCVDWLVDVVEKYNGLNAWRTRALKAEQTVGEKLDMADKKMRPVQFIHNRKTHQGQFHKWSHKKVVVGDVSNSGPVGLVETDAGNVVSVAPEDIQFTDNGTGLVVCKVCKAPIQPTEHVVAEPSGWVHAGCRGL